MNIQYSTPQQGEFFHLLTGINRDTCKTHVSTLCNSIKLMAGNRPLETGITRPVVVASFNFLDGVRRKYIIDGQHLFLALLTLDVKIPWVTIDVKDEEDLIQKIAHFNASSKTWIPSDYVRSWAWLREDFKTLLKLHNTTKLSINTLVMCLSLTDIRQRRDKNIVKNGTFSIPDVELGKACVNHFKDAVSLVKRGRITTRIFAEAFAKWYHDNHRHYNHEKFLTYVKNNRDIIEHFDDGNDEAKEFMLGYEGKSRIIALSA